jgi:hypothetical protein
MTVRLSADLADGRRILGGGFEFGGPRRGVGAIWWRYRGPRLNDDEHEHERLLNETYDRRRRLGSQRSPAATVYRTRYSSRRPRMLARP